MIIFEVMDVDVDVAPHRIVVAGEVTHREATGELVGMVQGKETFKEDMVDKTRACHSTLPRASYHTKVRKVLRTFGLLFCI